MQYTLVEIDVDIKPARLTHNRYLAGGLILDMAGDIQIEDITAGTVVEAAFGVVRKPGFGLPKLVDRLLIYAVVSPLDGVAPTKMSSLLDDRPAHAPAGMVSKTVTLPAEDWATAYDLGAGNYSAGLRVAVQAARPPAWAFVEQVHAWPGPLDIVDLKDGRVIAVDANGARVFETEEQFWTHVKENSR